MGLTEFLYNTILFLLKGNRDFFKLIDEFHEKLPPQNKRATNFKESNLGITTIDTTNMKMNLTTTEIDLFHKKLETFKYHKIYFGRKCKLPQKLAILN